MLFKTQVSVILTLQSRISYPPTPSPAPLLCLPREGLEAGSPFFVDLPPPPVFESLLEPLLASVARSAWRGQVGCSRWYRGDTGLALLQSGRFWCWCSQFTCQLPCVRVNVRGCMYAFRFSLAPSISESSLVYQEGSCILDLSSDNVSNPSPRWASHHLVQWWSWWFCVPLTSMLLHVERWEFSTAGVLLWVSQIHRGLGWDRAATYAFQAYISPTECSSWPRWTAFGNLQVNTLLYIQICPPLKTPGDMCQVNTVFSSFSGSRTYKGQHAILLFS